MCKIIPDDSGFAAHNLTILNIKSKTLCQAAETTIWCWLSNIRTDEKGCTHTQTVNLRSQL